MFNCLYFNVNLAVKSNLGVVETIKHINIQNV